MPDRLRLRVGIPGGHPGGIQTEGEQADPPAETTCRAGYIGPGPSSLPGSHFFSMRAHPISPVTEPLQYRAIGVVRGVYRPTDPELPTRGVILTEDGSELEAVVLGRLLTLMRRHLEMDKPHLWVVYPRSRDENSLHLQMVGVWEPSTLGAVDEGEASEVADSSEVTDSRELSEASEVIEAGAPEEAAPPAVAPSLGAAGDALAEGDDYFSVRGELIYTRPETGDLVVKVRQLPRADGNRPIPFKLQLRGEVPLEHLRHFVSLDLRRQGQHLCLERLEVVAPLAQRGTRGGKGRRPPGGGGGGGQRGAAGRRGPDRIEGEGPGSGRSGAERSGGGAERRPRQVAAGRTTEAPPRSHGQAVSRPSR